MASISVRKRLPRRRRRLPSPRRATPRGWRSKLCGAAACAARKHEQTYPQYRRRLLMAAMSRVGRDVEHVARTVDEDVVVAVLHGLELRGASAAGWWLGPRMSRSLEDHADPRRCRLIECRHESPIAPCGMWSTRRTSGRKVRAAARMISFRTARTSVNGIESETAASLPGPACGWMAAEVFVPRRGGEELAEWRVADGEDAGAGLRGRNRREQGRAPQVPQTQAVLGVDQQTRPHAWLTCQVLADGISTRSSSDAMSCAARCATPPAPQSRSDGAQQTTRGGSCAVWVLPSAWGTSPALVALHDAAGRRRPAR